VESYRLERLDVTTINEASKLGIPAGVQSFSPLEEYASYVRYSYDPDALKEYRHTRRLPAYTCPASTYSSLSKVAPGEKKLP
jgi:hypothetical protein